MNLKRLKGLILRVKDSLTLPQRETLRQYKEAKAALDEAINSNEDDEVTDQLEERVNDLYNQLQTMGYNVERLTRP